MVEGEVFKFSIKCFVGKLFGSVGLICVEVVLGLFYDVYFLRMFFGVLFLM